MSEAQEVATQQGANLSVEDAAESFLSRWTTEDAEQPSETEQEETPDSQETATEAEAPAVEESEDSEEATEESEETEEDPQDTDPASLDAKVKFKADGQEVEVSIKDLTRLYGQEAALTQKSMAVSEKEKSLSQAQEYTESVLEIALAQAEEDLKPYADIDWVVASKRLSEEELTALRGEAQKVYDKYQKLTSKVGDYQKAKAEKQQKEVMEVVKKTHETLSDPDKGIPGWGKEKFQELSTYAEGLGFAKEAVNSFITPEVWQLLNKAYQFDRGKQVATEKINKSPKNLVTSTKKPVTAQEASNSRAKEALKALSKNPNSREAAQDAFLARWSK